MKRLLLFLMTALGISSACGQKNYEDTDVEEFARLTKQPDVVILDVRTADEYAEGHIEGALNIDVKRSDFVEQAKSRLPQSKTIAVYCRSGRRSAFAATQLAAEGYKCVNMKGGYEAWKAKYEPQGD